jgi:hypothetical protein
MITNQPQLYWEWPTAFKDRREPDAVLDTVAAGDAGVGLNCDEAMSVWLGSLVNHPLLNVGSQAAIRLLANGDSGVSNGLHAMSLCC